MSDDDDTQIRAALAANPFPPSPWIKVTDDGIIIKAGYSDTLQRMLRWVPKVQWVPEKRYWKVPLAGAELVRSVLPEISRLAEATHEPIGQPESGALRHAPADTNAASSRHSVDDCRTPRLTAARDLFRDAARFLYGTDWQRDTARALGRDEAALACWLVGDDVLEDDPVVLLKEMLSLMRRRAVAITSAADQLEAALACKEVEDADESV